MGVLAENQRKEMEERKGNSLFEEVFLAISIESYFRVRGLICECGERRRENESASGEEERGESGRKRMEEVWKLTECVDAYASLSDVLER